MHARDADRVAGLLEANGIFNTKLLVNRVRPDMIQRNDMMSVRDVQEMLGIPLLGAIPEDQQARGHVWRCCCGWVCVGGGGLGAARRRRTHAWWLSTRVRHP
jgi:hypothetical protein